MSETERERILRQCYGMGEFVFNMDAALWFWRTRLGRYYISAEQMRALADELDRRNAESKAAR